MEWKQIRAHYEHLMVAAKKQGLTQEKIAEQGGLIGKTGKPQQNAISKLLHNGRRGPRVGTLLKAIKGLGMDVSTFFEQVEKRVALGDAAPAVPDDQLPRLIGTNPRVEQTVRSFIEAVLAVQSMSSSPRRRESGRPRRRAPKSG